MDLVYHGRRSSPDSAFPYDGDSPVTFSQLAYGTSIPFPILQQLVMPEIAVIAGKPEEPAPLVGVPKAPVNEDGRPVFFSDNVWPSWQSTVMQAVSNAACKKPFANYHFRQCVLAADATHHDGSHCWFDDVCH